MMSGGYLNEIPPPHRRRWPGDPEPRTVRVEIGTYIGFAPGARHFWASYWQEDNPIWNPVIGRFNAGLPTGWQMCWDDQEGKGAYDQQSCTSIRQAIRWLKVATAQLFPDHQVTRHGLPVDWEQWQNELEEEWGDLN